MTFAGVVFDFDGVIVDSERHWPEADNAYFKKHMPAWKDEYHAGLVGRSLAEAHDILVKRHGFKLSMDSFAASYEAVAVEMYGSIVKILENFNSVLDLLGTTDKKRAIASSSKAAWIDAALKRHALNGAFPVIVTAYDSPIKAGKPAPDIYLHAAERLGEDPSSLVAIEDSTNGVRSAKAAGLYCLGLVNGFNQDQDLSEADEIITGYGDKSLATLARLLA
jgi:HAD superfamily hydrolase (TIGR01509 family)